MFFNESLYLEDEDLDVSTEETMSDDEIKEAADSSFEEPVQDEADVVKENYEFMIESQRQYYNLREKMMKLEHMAIMKNQKGLVSEASAMLSEAKEGFKEKIKGILKTIKEKIIALWKRVMGFFKKIGEDIKNAAKKVKDKVGKEAGEETTVRTFKVDSVKAFSVLIKNAKVSFKYLNNYNSKLQKILSGEDKVNEADLEFEKAKDIQEKIKNYLDRELTYEDIKLTKSLVASKIKTVKMYNKAAADITSMESEATKIVDEAQKVVESQTEDAGSLVNKAYKSASTANAIFNSCTTAIVKLYSNANSIAINYYAMV